MHEEVSEVFVSSAMAMWGFPCLFLLSSFLITYFRQLFVLSRRITHQRLLLRVLELLVVVLLILVVQIARLHEQHDRAAEESNQEESKGRLLFSHSVSPKRGIHGSGRLQHHVDHKRNDRWRSGRVVNVEPLVNDHKVHVTESA